MQRAGGKAGGQAKAQGGPLGGSERRGLAQRRTAGLRPGWARCCGAGTGRGSSGRPPPTAWPLAVNTERTSSVSLEMFISGRVGSVRWPLPVLPAGWPGAGGEGLDSLGGQSVGRLRQGQEGCAPRLPPGAGV